MNAPSDAVHLRRLSSILPNVCHVTERTEEVKEKRKAVVCPVLGLLLSHILKRLSENAPQERQEPPTGYAGGRSDEQHLRISSEPVYIGWLPRIRNCTVIGLHQVLYKP